MKKLLIVFLIFLPLVANAQLGADGKTDQVQRDKPASVSLKAPLHHYILYSANFPYGAIGLKYGITYKWFGIYASGALSVDYEDFTYFTGGFLFKTAKNNCIYIGSGAGPFEEIDRYTTYFSGLHDVVFEAGSYLSLDRVTFDVGLGYEIWMERLYFKLGIGANF